MAELFDILKYAYNKQQHPNLADTFVTVASVTLVAAPVGLYEIGYSFEVDFNGKKDTPAYFRMGGTFGSATEFSLVAEANADHKNRYYTFPKDHVVEGDITVSLEMRKSAAITLFDVDWADVMIKRVK